MKIFGPRRDEVTGDWRRMHNEGLHGMYSSPNIIRVIISRRDGWGMWHVRWRGEVYTRFWWGNLRERDHLEDSGVDGTKLNGIFKKLDGSIKWSDLA
jgi:MoaA/NifB/PqqE/SkfB family radical SAM enzyme